MARLAKSLETLRMQINAAFPNRSKSSDGWIGDAAHQATASDHNPGPDGVVEAFDATHDPAHGFDSWKFAEMLRVRRDARIEYVISNGRIVFAGGSQPWQWQKYNGRNAHSQHVHISVQPAPSMYDDPRPWDIGGDWGGNVPPTPRPDVKPLLKRGAFNEDVMRLQGLLKIPVDGVFGNGTELAVRAFQKSKGLIADGIVGPKTWAALENK